MQQHITQYRMKALCEALAVSRSGYRSWLYRPVNRYKLAFREAVSTCYLAQKARAGAPSIAAEIQARGYIVAYSDHKRVRDHVHAHLRNNHVHAHHRNNMAVHHNSRT